MGWGGLGWSRGLGRQCAGWKGSRWGCRCSCWGGCWDWGLSWDRSWSSGGGGWRRDGEGILGETHTRHECAELPSFSEFALRSERYHEQARVAKKQSTFQSQVTWSSEASGVEGTFHTSWMTTTRCSVSCSFSSFFWKYAIFAATNSASALWKRFLVSECSRKNTTCKSTGQTLQIQNHD